MSLESAKAFCARMMSDDEFRNEIGKAPTAEAIAKILTDNGYEFGKNDLLKVIGDLMGKKIAIEDLSEMVCAVYEEEIKSKDGGGSTEAVAKWLESLA